MSLFVDQSGRPSPATQYASHILVGAIAATAIGKQQGPEGAMVAFLIVALCHAYLDAPVAGVLVDLLA